MFYKSTLALEREKKCMVYSDVFAFVIQESNEPINKDEVEKNSDLSGKQFFCFTVRPNK